MKVSISESEWYPVYTLAKSTNGLEIPDDLHERYEANMREFNVIQGRLSEIYRAPDNSAEGSR